MIKYIFNYFKSLLWIILINYDNEDEIKYHCLLKSVKNCGCIPIKFIQWLIPILYLILNEKYYQYIDIFKDTYETCEFHSLEYIYHQTVSQKMVKERRSRPDKSVV